MERELKFILPTADAYERLISLPGAEEPVEQINHYFHGAPDGPLARGEAMFRIRERSGLYTAAFKARLRVEGAYFQSQETERVLDSAQAQAWILDGISRPAPQGSPLALAFKADPAPRLICAGRSHTWRTKVPLSSGDVLEIDRSTFPCGGVDWEIEVETLQPGELEAELHALAGTLGFALKPQTRTKYRRFLDGLHAKLEIQPPPPSA